MDHHQTPCKNGFFQEISILLKTNLIYRIFLFKKQTHFQSQSMIQNIFYNSKMQVQRCSRQYKTINCCSQGASCGQILAIGLFTIIQLISFNLIPKMLATESSAMYFLMGLTYLTLIFLILDYIGLLISDPSDPRLMGRPIANSEDEAALKECVKCSVNVDQGSYHCQSCNRCVQGFDHHCSFINNCIGKQNYSQFLRLLISIIIHTSSSIGISVWIMLVNSIPDVYFWVSLAWAILSFAVFVEVVSLAIFHCYISFYLYKTTLEVLRGDQKNKVGNQNHNTLTLKVRVTSQDSGINLAKQQNLNDPIAQRS